MFQGKHFGIMGGDYRGGEHDRRNTRDYGRDYGREVRSDFRGGEYLEELDLLRKGWVQAG